MTSTTAIGLPPSGPSELHENNPEVFANQAQAASFKDALAGADRPAAGVSPAPTLSLDPSALNAADEAWVNFVAISEQLQNPGLSREKQNTLLAELEEKLRAFREQSGPLVQQVDSYFASQMPSKV